MDILQVHPVMHCQEIFGWNYCSDISYMNVATGQKPIPTPNHNITVKVKCEGCHTSYRSIDTVLNALS